MVSNIIPGFSDSLKGLTDSKIIILMGMVYHNEQMQRKSADDAISTTPNVVETRSKLPRVSFPVESFKMH